MILRNLLIIGLQPIISRGALLSNTGSIFSPATSIRDLSLLEACSGGIEYRDACLDASDALEVTCGFRRAGETNVNYWTTSYDMIFAAASSWTNTFMDYESTIVSYLEQWIGDSEGPIDMVEILNEDVLWANWTPWLIAFTIFVVVWSVVFFTVICLPCRCCRVLLSICSCGQCCRDRTRATPFWASGRFNLCWFESTAWIIHVIMLTGLVWATYVVVLLSRPQMMAAFGCQSAILVKRLARAPPSEQWSLEGMADQFVDQLRPALSFDVGYRPNHHLRASSSPLNSCLSPLLGSLRDDPNTTPSGPNYYLLDREDQTWIKGTNPILNTPVQPSNRYSVAIPYLDTLTLNVQTDTNQFGCGHQSAYVFDAFSAYYKRFAWGRLARSMGQMIRVDSEAINELKWTDGKQEWQGLFPQQDSYIGTPSACHQCLRPIGLFNCSPACSSIRALKVDYENAFPRSDSFGREYKLPSMVGSALPLSNHVDKEKSKQSEQLLLHAERSLDHRPDQFYLHSNDIYSVEGQSLYPPITTPLKSSYLPSILDHILQEGSVEGPSLIALAALVPEPKGNGIPLDTSEVSTLLLRAHTLTEFATCETGGELQFMTSTKDWIGNPSSDDDASTLPFLINQIIREDGILSEFHTNSWGWDKGKEFASARYVDGSSGRSHLTRKTLWPRHGRNPSIKGWVDYYRSYGPSDSDPIIEEDNTMSNGTAHDLTVIMDSTEKGTLRLFGSILPAHLADPLSAFIYLTQTNMPGWAVTRSTSEQLPFMQFHKPNLMMDSIVDVGSTYISEALLTWDTSMYDTILSQEMSILKFVPMLMDVFTRYSWGLGIQNNDELQSTFAIHYWIAFGLFLFLLLPIITWIISSIIFGSLAIRHVTKKDPSTKASAGCIYRSLCMVITIEMIFGVILAGIGTIAIPLSGEVDAVCSSDWSFAIDETLKGHIDSTSGLSTTAMSHCILEGQPLTEDDLDDFVALDALDPSRFMTVVRTAMNMLSKSYRGFDVPIDLKGWSMPIVSPSTLLGGPEAGSLHLVSMHDVLNHLEIRQPEAITAINEDLDAVIVATPSGLIDLSESQRSVNIAMSPFQPNLGLVSAPLAAVSIRSHLGRHSVSSAAQMLIEASIDEAIRLGEASVIHTKNHPVWLGGPERHVYGEALDCQSEDSVFCTILDTGDIPSANLAGEYRKQFGDADVNDPKRLVLPILEPDYKDALDSMMDQQAIPSWATAAHRVLEELYGGPELLRAPPSRRNFCDGGDYFDICVLGHIIPRTGKANLIPVAGRCSLIEDSTKPFNVEEKCARYNNPNHEASLSDRYLCIQPLRTSDDPLGDRFAESDLFGPESDTVSSLLSGLVPGLRSVLGGRMARFIDPICPLLCDDDILLGASYTHDQNRGDQGCFSGGKEELFEGLMPFGVVSWYGTNGPKLTSFIPPLVESNRPLRYLRDYRSCLMPNQSYPIGTGGKVHVEKIPEMGDAHQRYLRFMANMEHIQALATVSSEYAFRWSDRRNRLLFKSQLERDLSNLPTHTNMALSPDGIFEAVAEKLGDINHFTSIVNDVLRCDQINAAVQEATRILCLIPSGGLAVLAWPCFIMGWITLLVGLISIQHIHYWIDRAHQDPPPSNPLIFR